MMRQKYAIELHSISTRSCYSLLYSGRVSLVQIFVEKRADSSEEIFRGFYFRGCATLWPHPYQLMAMPHMWNGTEQRSLVPRLLGGGWGGGGESLGARL